MIKGKEKEQKSYSKFVGLFNAHIVAVNPTKTELEKLLDTTLAKDVEYTGVNGENNTKTLTLSFWLKDVGTGQLFNVRFNLEDTVATSSTGKIQYINNIGTSSYAVDKNSVPAFLTENGRQIREAHKGEELLYKLLRAWLSNLDYTNDSVDLSVDWKKLISGKVNEIKEAIANYPTQEVCALATVRTALDGKEYQSVYSYEFMPSFALNSFSTKGTKNYKTVDRFIERVTDPNYGCRDYYELTPLHVYDPSKNVINTTNVPIINKLESGVKDPVDVTEDIADDLPF